jgi:predicted phage terminase large subunit-like protein
MPKLSAYRELICYTDPSFKASSKNDYKASFLIGKLGNEIHILKVFCRQTSVSNMVKWAYDLEESKPENVIITYYMEANFIQDMLLDEYVTEGNARGWQLNIRGDKRSKPDKFQRIEATSPFFERGFVFWNESEKDSFDMKTAIEQFLAFQKGSRSADDAPDAFEGGLHYLQKRTRFEGDEPKSRMGKYKYNSNRKF